MGDMDAVTEVLSNAGLNATTILESTQDAEVKGNLSATPRPLLRGVYLVLRQCLLTEKCFLAKTGFNFVEAVLQQKDH